MNIAVGLHVIWCFVWAGGLSKSTAMWMQVEKFSNLRADVPLPQNNNDLGGVTVRRDYATTPTESQNPQLGGRVMDTSL